MSDNMAFHETWIYWAIKSLGKADVLFSAALKLVQYQSSHFFPHSRLYSSTTCSGCCCFHIGHGISMNWTTGDATSRDVTKPFWHYRELCVLIASYDHSVIIIRFSNLSYTLLLITLALYIRSNLWMQYSIYHVSLNSDAYSYSLTLIITIYIIISDNFRTMLTGPWHFTVLVRILHYKILILHYKMLNCQLGDFVKQAWQPCLRPLLPNCLFLH